MTAILLMALFIVSAFAAGAVIWTTLAQYSGKARCLRDHIRICPDTQEVRFSISELSVTARAKVLRPVITVGKPGHPQQRGMRAAA